MWKRHLPTLLHSRNPCSTPRPSPGPREASPLRSAVHLPRVGLSATTPSTELRSSRNNSCVRRHAAVTDGLLFTPQLLYFGRPRIGERSGSTQGIPSRICTSKAAPIDQRSEDGVLAEIQTHIRNAGQLRPPVAKSATEADPLTAGRFEDLRQRTSPTERSPLRCKLPVSAHPHRSHRIRQHVHAAGARSAKPKPLNTLASHSHSPSEQGNVGSYRIPTFQANRARSAAVPSHPKPQPATHMNAPGTSAR